MPPPPSDLLRRLRDRIAAVPWRTKFGRDVVWTLVSFGILGVSGIVLNVIIGRIYGPSVLGAFNQVFALHFLLSQIAAFGIHYSAIKHIAEFADDVPQCNAILSSALGVTAVCATGVTLAGHLLAGPIGLAFGSEAVATGWVCVLPGLWCFALNKVLFGVLNGKRMMRAFAVGQAARYVLFIVFLVVGAAVALPGATLPLVITGAEAVVLLYLLACVLGVHRLVGVGRWAGWGRRHLHFGARSFLSGAMDGLNAHVDVLLLGCFADDHAVGIYGMASLLVKGLALLSVVLRHNVNPLLTQYAAQGQLDELRRTVRRGVRVFYVVMAVLGVATVLLYPLVVIVLVGNPEFLLSWGPCAILVAGLIACAGYLPFSMLLVQTGHPGAHTVLNVAIVATNLALGALLIPWLGIHGAALAVAATFVLSALYLKLLVRARLGIRI